MRLLRADKSTLAMTRINVVSASLMKSCEAVSFSVGSMIMNKKTRVLYMWKGIALSLSLLAMT